MLSKNDGLILVEILLSLSALFMVSLFFTPLLIDLTKQTQQLQREEHAFQYVNDELQALIMNGQPSSDHSTVLNHIEYQITWRDTENDGQKEVCVKVAKNSLLSETKICGLSE